MSTKITDIRLFVFGGCKEFYTNRVLLLLQCIKGEDNNPVVAINYRRLIN